MPLAPYSNGILPGGYASPGEVIPNPPPPLTPAVSGAAVNANGSLVSFLPPVTDWFTPAAQTLAPATGQAEHPCQGGGACGCGGTCRKAYSASEQGTIIPNSTNPKDLTMVDDNFLAAIGNNQYILAGSSTDSEPFIKEISKQPNSEGISSNRPTSFREIGRFDPSKISNALSLRFGYADGYTETTLATVENNGDVRVRVNDVGEGRNILDVTFPKGNSGWLVGTDSEINPESGLFAFALGPWAALYAIRMAANAKTSVVENGQTPSGNQDGIVCMNGNLGCASQTASHTLLYPFGATVLSVSSGGGFLTVDMDGFGGSIDVSYCCSQYAVDRWCASTTDQAPLNNVAACIAGAAYAAIYNNMLSVQNIAATLTWFVAALLTGGAAGEFLLGDLIWTTGFIFDWVKSELSGPYPYAGQGVGTNSCLCGGTQPTTLCSDPCTDLCAAFKKTANEECYHCGWKCNYDPNTGKLLDPNLIFDSGSSPDQSDCCPGTSMGCNPQKPICAAFDCQQCCWIAEVDPYTWLTYWKSTKLGNKPCCKTSPVKPPKPPTPLEEARPPKIIC